MPLNVDVGTVIKWNNFPTPRIGSEIKPRWFICVGFSGHFAQVAVIYLYTTTTQLEHFEGTGDRSSHSRFIFKCDQYPVFEQDCAVDFDESPYPIKETDFEQKENDIEVKGRLDEQTLRMVYKRLLPSRYISHKVLIDIHDSYNRAGITGLKKPKSHNKK